MEDILMSEKEAERLRLMKNHADGMISLHAVSSLLDLSYRQTLRIWNNFKLKGAVGLVSRKRKNQNRSLDPELEQTILTLIRNKYHDYGPTLIATAHKIEVS
jgi:transposase